MVIHISDVGARIRRVLFGQDDCYDMENDPHQPNTRVTCYLPPASEIGWQTVTVFADNDNVAYTEKRMNRFVRGEFLGISKLYGPVQGYTYVEINVTDLGDRINRVTFGDRDCVSSRSTRSTHESGRRAGRTDR